MEVKEIDLRYNVNNRGRVRESYPNWISYLIDPEPP